MFRGISIAAALAGCLAAHPAAAQDPLVNVNLQDVAIEIAKNLNIDVSNVPISILLPASIAANVCGVEVSALMSGTGGSPSTCSATNTTIATQVINNNITGGGSTGGTTSAGTGTTGGSMGAGTGTTAATTSTTTTTTERIDNDDRPTV